MIFLDRREPEEFVNAFKKLGAEVTSGVHLDYGDIMFEGNGENGSCMVAIERKKLSDLVNSMKDRRLAGHQLRGLWQRYDYVYLVCEGMWRPGPAGEIEHWATEKRKTRDGKWYSETGWTPFYSHADKRSVQYRHLAGYLHSLALRSRSPQHEPLRIIRTSNVVETAAQLISLHRNFTEKLWKDHHAHDQIHTALNGAAGLDAGGTGKHRASMAMAVAMEDPTTAWKMAAQLPGVDRKAQAVAAHFGSVTDMVLAGLDGKLRREVDKWFEEHPAAAVKAWQKALGVEKGTAKAKTVLKAMREAGA